MDETVVTYPFALVRLMGLKAVVAAAEAEFVAAGLKPSTRSAELLRKGVSMSKRMPALMVSLSETRQSSWMNDPM